MKRYFILCILFLIFSCISTDRSGKREIVPREPFFFGETNAVIENYFNQKTTPTLVSFRYNQKKEDSDRIKEKIEMYFNDYIYRTCITMNENDRKKMIDIINKYKNLMEKAKEEESKNEKEIGYINIDISWDVGENRWIETFNSKMYLNLYFAGKGAYNLKIYFSDAISDKGKHKPGVLYFKEEGVKELIEILSDNNYNRHLQRAE